MPIPGALWRTYISRSSPRLTSGRSSTPRTSVKIAALAPIPSASVSTTVMASPLVRASERRATLSSCTNKSGLIMVQPHKSRRQLDCRQCPRVSLAQTFQRWPVSWPHVPLNSCCKPFCTSLNVLCAIRVAWKPIPQRVGVILPSRLQNVNVFRSPGRPFAESGVHFVFSCLSSHRILTEGETWKRGTTLVFVRLHRKTPGRFEPCVKGPHWVYSFASCTNTVHCASHFRPSFHYTCTRAN